MLIYKPSASIKKITKIDFEILGKIINNAIDLCFKNHKLKGNVWVHKSRSDCSFYYYGSRRIELNPSFVAIYDFIIDILHETRHLIQDEHLEVDTEKLTVPFSSDKSWKIADDSKQFDRYEKSALEKDARNFESLATDIYCTYCNYLSMKERIKFRKMHLFNKGTGL